MLWNDCINLKYAAITLITSLGKFLILSIIKCYILYQLRPDTMCTKVKRFLMESNFKWLLLQVKPRYWGKTWLQSWSWKFSESCKTVRFTQTTLTISITKHQDLNRGAVLYLLFFYFNLAPNQAYLINRPQEKLATLFHVSIWRQVSKNIFKIQLL